MNEPTEEGWWNPRPFSSASRFHYVRAGRSLCGKWARLFGAGSVEQGNDEHTENCAACRKRLAREKGRAVTR